jgi:hypothetical protein
MVSAKPSFCRPSLTGMRLVGLLGELAVSLKVLNMWSANAADNGDPGALGYCPEQVRALCSILERGRHSIVRRAAELGGRIRREEPDRASRPPVLVTDPVAFMTAYRECCRKLCKALDESKRIPDATTGALLSDLALRLEKQLWLMDGSPHDRDAESCRSVSLFLAC